MGSLPLYGGTSARSCSVSKEIQNFFRNDCRALPQAGLGGMAKGALAWKSDKGRGRRFMFSRSPKNPRFEDVVRIAYHSKSDPHPCAILSKQIHKVIEGQKST